MAFGKSTTMKLIYYADDDIDDLRFLQDAVNGHGYTVVIFYTGQALIDTLQASPKKPDLIFMDVQMPIATGDDILKEIRRNRTYNNIPIVLITGSLKKAQIDRYIKEGANYMIKKANSIQSLKTTMDDVLYKQWENYRPHADDFKALITL